MKLDYLLLGVVLGIVIFLGGCASIKPSVTVDKSVNVTINLDNVECREDVCGTWPIWVWVDYKIDSKLDADVSLDQKQDISPDITTKLK